MPPKQHGTGGRKHDEPERILNNPGCPDKPVAEGAPAPTPLALPVCPQHGEAMYVGTTKTRQTSRGRIRFRYCYCPVPGCQEPGIKQLVPAFPGPYERGEAEPRD